MIAPPKCETFGEGGKSEHLFLDLALRSKSLVGNTHRP